MSERDGVDEPVGGAEAGEPAGWEARPQDGREAGPDAGADALSEAVDAGSAVAEMDGVPQWIADLVPIAERARGLLLGSVRYLLFALLMSGVFVAPSRRSVWALLACCVVIGVDMADRCRGRRGTHSSAWRRPQVSVAVLRPGGRVGAILVVADIVATGIGLIVWGTSAIVGAPHGLLTGALACAVTLSSAYLHTLLMEVLEPRTAWAAGWGILLFFALTACVYVGAHWQEAGGFAGLLGAWWWVIAMAVLCDVVAIAAYRVGRERDRESAAQ